MTLPIALKIMKMSAKALTKKYGSRAMGLSKRVKAGDMINKAKKGGSLASKKSAKINRKGGKNNIKPSQMDANSPKNEIEDYISEQEYWKKYNNR